MNLIKYRVSYTDPTFEQSKPKKGIFYKIGFVFLFVLSLIAGSIFINPGGKKASAFSNFSFDGNYDETLNLNKQFANIVPLPFDSIKTQQEVGDKRVIALLMFLQKYNSPMASLSVAKAFIESADRHGLGDKWQLLPAISGIESSFGKLIPYNENGSSYNAWGWTCVGSGCTSRWRYFSSWEEAIDVITEGLATYYGRDTLTPQTMMAKYCPDCAEGGGAWAVHVQGYMDEINSSL